MEKNLVVGNILKPQGIRGELKVKPFTDSADVFRGFKRVFLGGKEYKVLSVRVGDGAVFLSLRGVPDRNAAELLRGEDVVIPREDAPALGEGTYYIADLLGLEAVTAEGESLGKLVEIRQASADIYTLEKDGKQILFPAAKGVILSVDMEGGKLVVDKKRFSEVAVI